MTLPLVKPVYDARAERERSRTIEQEFKRRQRTDNDYEIGDNRLILKSPDGTRWSITVDNAGAISATSI